MPNLGPLLPSLFLFLITLPERLLTWCPIDRQETTKGRLALMAQRPAMSPTFAAAHLLPLKVALPRTPYGSLGSLSTEVPGVPLLVGLLCLFVLLLVLLSLISLGDEAVSSRYTRWNRSATQSPNVASSFLCRRDTAAFTVSCRSPRRYASLLSVTTSTSLRYKQ